MVSIEKKMELAQWLINPDKVLKLPAVWDFLGKKLKEYGLEKVFYEIELPLVGILDDMRKTGIKVNLDYLAKFSKELEKELFGLVEKIYKEAGGEFNINSPKQLSEVLFSKLKINPEGILKRKTGAFATDVETLTFLKSWHPIIEPILRYRELFKIKSTYVEPLRELADDEGRVHTTFVQTGTSTGRLSSQNPNLQNIPPSVRKVFVAEDGYKLVSFDYSQIELRVLASVADDSKMIEAFKNNIDIHALTASQVFNVDIKKVTKEQRHFAKTLNFGVIYGMGPNAFALQSGLSRAEAEKFIKEYFADFAEVRRWQEKTIDKARQLGYVENINGRKRWLPGIVSPNRRISSGAERAAVNMPIQGLAADIIKLAMLKVPRNNNIRLLLSIHDELLFEIKKESLREAVPKIKQIMESVYNLKVPLKGEVASGYNWGELEKH